MACLCPDECHEDSALAESGSKHLALRHLTLLISRHLVPQRVITGNVSSGDADIKQILHLPKRTETRLIRPVRVHNTAKLPEPPFKLRIISFY